MKCVKVPLRQLNDTRIKLMENGLMNMFLGKVEPNATGDYVLTTEQQTDTQGKKGGADNSKSIIK